MFQSYVNQFSIGSFDKIKETPFKVKSPDTHLVATKVIQIYMPYKSAWANVLTNSCVMELAQ